ncbi:hypothetical protein BS78_05G254600 [Paspalum vaginatum]|nr:hypothetical protein BS78_05G254600 [Paspalum vaginatum]
MMLPQLLLELVLVDDGVVGAAHGTHEEGVEDVVHGIGLLPDLFGPGLDLRVEPVRWHVVDLLEEGLRGLELQRQHLLLFFELCDCGLVFQTMAESALNLIVSIIFKKIIRPKF